MKHKKVPQKVPEFLRRYFWDVDFDKLDPKKNQHLIIKRVLDRGKTSDIRWLLTTYNLEDIKEVLLKTRDLSRPTGTLWTDVLGLDRHKVICLQKPYFPIHFGLYS